MTSRILALVLAVSLPASASAQTLSAQFDWKKPVFGAQRLPAAALDQTRVPARVTVMETDEIRASGARTLQELLSRLPEFHMIDANGNAYQQTLDMRGFNASPVPNTAVVVDGVRVNEADFGQVNYQLIPLENVARVEVHPGPSTRYGKNALAGVVHITTKRGQGPVSVETGMGYGAHDRAKAWASASGEAAGLDYLFSASKEQHHGFRQHSDAAIATAMLKVGRKRESADTQFGYTRADDRLQQPGSLTGGEIASNYEAARSNVDTISRMDFVTLSHRQALPGDLTAFLQGHVRARREATPLNRGRSSISRSISDMRTHGVTGQISRESEVFGRSVVTSVGGEGTTSEADSQSSGSFGAFPFSSGNFSRDRSLGGFFQNTADLVEDRLTLTTGVRHDAVAVAYTDKVTPANSGRQSWTRTTPSVGLNFTASPAIRAYASFSEAFRAPTVNEVTALGPFGQQALRPVKARNYELGGALKLAEEAELSAAAFRNEVRDEIFAVFDPTAGFGKNINIPRTLRTGVEWTLKGRNRIASASLGHAYVKSTFRADMRMDSVPFGATQSVAAGDSLPASPEHKINAGVDFYPADGWTVGWKGRCVSSQNLFGDESNNEPQLPAFCSLDLGASLERGGWRFFLNGTNLTDQRQLQRGILATNNATNAKDRFFVTTEGAGVFGGASYRFTASGDKTAAAGKAGIAETARRALRRWFGERDG